MHYNYLLAIQDINPLDGLKKKIIYDKLFGKLELKK